MQWQHPSPPEKRRKYYRERKLEGFIPRASGWASQVMVGTTTWLLFALQERDSSWAHTHTHTHTHTLPVDGELTSSKWCCNSGMTPPSPAFWNLSSLKGNLLTIVMFFLISESLFICRFWPCQMCYAKGMIHGWGHLSTKNQLNIWREWSLKLATFRVKHFYITQFQ